LRMNRRPAGWKTCETAVKNVCATPLRRSSAHLGNTPVRSLVIPANPGKAEIPYLISYTFMGSLDLSSDRAV
jgi:hypothetical protein